MYFETKITEASIESLRELYTADVLPESINIQKTKKEFTGDFTLPAFPFVKLSRKSPEQTAEEIGKALKEKLDFIESYNIIKGFLNLSLSHQIWIDFLHKGVQNPDYGNTSATSANQPILIEFSSPNTNKPLHLGHVRNNLLGDAVSRIIEANGNKVVRVNLVNDRGIHICKSMLAHQKFGKDETPQSTGMKGDKLVGKYYVAFDKQYKAEIEQLINQGKSKEDAEKQAPILLEAQQMLRLWEEGDKDIRKLWENMNQWVYEGFEQTYNNLGITFDRVYYESETYLLGKEIVKEGLEKKVFYQHPDGSVRVDLQAEGLDEKILLRSDGTSVYITQDLGTAVLRAKEYHPQQMIYVVGNEQNYHFDVLKRILYNKLSYDWGERIYHLSYGMVELPSGKMKSREGTVVDADDLMDEMISIAKQKTKELGKNDFNDEELNVLARMIGIGALKYFMLKVDPKKNMLFNPEESIDLNGNTAPFIQYTHARICSLLRKAGVNTLELPTHHIDVIPKAEKEILSMLYEYPATVKQAASELNPSLLANFAYELVKAYNRFYQDTPVLKETNENLRHFRLQLSAFTASVLRKAMNLLGIDLPEKM